MKLNSVSASSLSVFDQCCLKFYAVYVLGMKEEPSPAAAIGTTVHKFFEKLLMEKKVPDIKQLCSEFKVLDIDMVKLLCENTLKMNYLDDHRYMLKCEYPFKITLNDQKTLSKGFIDRLDIYGNKAVIHDLKTGKTPYTKKELANNYQAKIYNIAIRKCFPEINETKVIFWFVKPGIKQEVNFTEEITKLDEQLIIDKAEQIRSIEDPLPRKNKYCNWCLYKTKCSLYNLK